MAIEIIDGDAVVRYKKTQSRVVYMVLILLAVLLVLPAVLTGFLLAVSPGEMMPVVKADGEKARGGITEKTFVKIGDVEQGMFIRGESTSNPVLLFIHGGPCFSEYFLFEKYPTGLEEIFTICHWEQRGGGLSYQPEISPDSITMEQLQKDTTDVTNYLRKRFGQEKIYLAAHSGGTFFAIQAAAQAPELYHAYLGFAQITNQTESETIAYRYMMDAYLASGNTRMMNKLKKYPVLTDNGSIDDFFKSMLRDQAMHDLGIGTMRTMRSLETGIVLPVLQCRAYTLKEKFNLWKSKILFIRKTPLVDQILAQDLTQKYTSFEIPVYFFSGKYDFTVNHDLAESYLEELSAPAKAFYRFEHSAHSPMFEEPEKVVEIIRRDILRNNRPE